MKNTHRIQFGVVHNEQWNLIYFGAKHGQAIGVQAAAAMRVDGVARRQLLDVGSALGEEGSVATDKQSKRESISLLNCGIITGTESHVLVSSYSHAAAAATAEHKNDLQ